MLDSNHQAAARPQRFACAQERPDVGELIRSLGRHTFEYELVRCLHEMYAADKYYVFHHVNGRPRGITATSYDGSRAAEGQYQRYMEWQMWRFDPSLMEVVSQDQPRTVLLHLDAERPETTQLRDFYCREGMSDRLLACGRGPDGASLALSVVRSRQPGSCGGEWRGRIEWLSDLLFPLLVKHHMLSRENRQLADAITSLEQIEMHLALVGTHIPRREAQVIARTLYGMTANGIALDLDISSETVTTYRKSFYKRMEIAGFRELLVWYLKLCGEVGHRLPSLAHLQPRNLPI